MSDKPSSGARRIELMLRGNPSADPLWKALVIDEFANKKEKQASREAIQAFSARLKEELSQIPYAKNIKSSSEFDVRYPNEIISDTLEIIDQLQSEYLKEQG